jgi:hypothetical protein
MKTRSAAPLSLLVSCALFALSAGCASGPETEYSASRAASLNGTSVFAELLRQRGHTVRAAVRLTDELAEWAEGIVRFAPYPGPPEADEAQWIHNWLAEYPERWLIYVVRDFDASAEYWKEVRDGIPESTDPKRRAEAEENRVEAADWVHRLPPKAKDTGSPRDWFTVEAGASPPEVCTKVEGLWADGVDAGAAALWLHEAIKADRRGVMLSGNGKALVFDKSVIGQGNMLIIANGSFLLNEALVNPARRKLALRVAEWPDQEKQQVAFVEGSYVMSEEEGVPSLWKLMQRLPPLKWVAIQMFVAGIFAALARAPRLGRPRPDPVSGADRPAAHAEALGTLLAASRATSESLDLLERYRHWRWPHGPRETGRVSGRYHAAGRATETRSSVKPSAPAKESPPAQSASPIDPDFS